MDNANAEEPLQSSSDTQHNASVPDVDRREMPWQRKEEELITQWAQKCHDNSAKHKRRAVIYRVLHFVFGLTSTFVPIGFTGVTLLGNEDPVVIASGFITSSCLSSIVNMFNFKNMADAHKEHSARYDSMATSIEVELVKPRPFRIACDLFLARTELLIGQVNNSAPGI